MNASCPWITNGSSSAAATRSATAGAAVETLQLETDLRAARANGELHLAYQPIIDLATGRPVGVEALARWDHPRLGAIGPDRFIPVAEQTGFIREIGWWVLETAARQASAWRHATGRGLDDLRLSVNLSTRQLHDRELADRIVRLLREVELPATSLTLELTEDAFAGSEATLVAALARLRAEGLRIAIDDFGSGYSTLGRLRRLPIDEVKIDRAFIDPLQSAADAAVVRTMLELARALGLRVVAEGVETPAQRDALRQMGCEMAQGYLFGRPMDAETVFGSADLERGASPAA